MSIVERAFLIKVITLNQCSQEKRHAQTAHTDIKGYVKIFKSPRLLPDASAGKSKCSIPAIMWMLLLSLQNYSDVCHTLLNSDWKKIKWCEIVFKGLAYPMKYNLTHASSSHAESFEYICTVLTPNSVEMNGIQLLCALSIENVCLKTLRKVSFQIQWQHLMNNVQTSQLTVNFD